MNLEESNSFVERMEKNNKNKKSVLTILLICTLLIIVLLGLIWYLRYKDSQVLKMYIDEKNVSISNTLLVQNGNQTYISIKELANILGYSYQKGEYKKYTEDSNSCYLKTPYEIVSMSADENKMTKYILNEEEKTTQSSSNKDEEVTENEDLIVIDETTGAQSLNIIVASPNETVETISIEEPIKYINNELYVSFAELPRVFNVSLTLKPNRIMIYSLKYLATRANQIAQNLGYESASNIYENLTAMVDDMLVVKSGKNYGVISLSRSSEIVSLKYEKMVYMQNTEEFLVTAEGSVGIVSKEGNTIIKPTEYDNISILDESNKLYLVEKDSKFGVLNGAGETVVYPEYNLIGIDEENKNEFQNEGIRNYCLLFENCIPVHLNNKVGIIDVDGKEVLKCSYDSLGYIANSKTTDKEENKTTKNSYNEEDEDNEEETNSVANNLTTSSKVVDEHDSVLTIPESSGIKGIVVNLKGLYGIFDAESKRLIAPCVFEKIYSKTKSGVTKYYLVLNEQEIGLEEYLTENDLKSVTTNSNKTQIQSKEIQDIENFEE